MGLHSPDHLTVSMCINVVTLHSSTEFTMLNLGSNILSCRPFLCGKQSLETYIGAVHQLFEELEILVLLEGAP